MQLRLVLLWLVVATVLQQAAADSNIIVYGATPAGIAAALYAADTPANGILLLEPSHDIGGMVTAGGIGMRDFQESARLTGKMLQWAMLNAAHYNVAYPVWQPDHWVGNASWWAMLNNRSSSIRVVMGARLAEGGAGVQMQATPSGPRIAALTTLDGTRYPLAPSGVVVDASYEGEVMIAAGVGHTWGREPKAAFNESYGGVTATSAGQFRLDVDATWPNGTLLKYVQAGPDPRTRLGAGDENVMAYSYRVCLTTNTTNQAPFTAPDGYQTADFELLRRYIQLQLKANVSVDQPWGDLPYRSYPPGNKFDACCGPASVGIDAPGLAVGYANGTLADRARITAEHRYYVQGLLWFYAHDPDSGVPANVRAGINKYGLCKDEWPENNHWPPQLYVREAARLVGDRVFSQNDRVMASCTSCRNDSIALGDWGLDIHEMERVAVVSNETASGLKAYNEGLSSPGQGGAFIFELPYWVLLPSARQAVNLLLPNTPSVTHVAFAGIREEPTLWQLGAASGVSAALVSATTGLTVQTVSVQDIQAGLLQQGNLIHWPARPNCSCAAECTKFSVTGAGSAEANGVYQYLGEQSDNAPVYQNKGSNSTIYRYVGIWRVAVRGVKLFYTNPAHPYATTPPLAGWTLGPQGVAPTPFVPCKNSTDN